MSHKVWRASGVAFLSEEAEEFEEKAVAAHHRFFGVFSRASTAAYDALARMNVDRSNRVELYGVCALARLCESCQAAAYLSARGFAQETAVEVRVALEALLKFKAALTNRSLTEGIIDSDLLEVRKLGNLILNGEVSGLTSENRPEVEARQAELQREIAERGIKKISTEELARGVDALGLYHTVFRLTSSNVHISPRSLAEYVRLHGATGQPEEIVYGPNHAYVDVHLHAVTEFLLIAISLLERHRGLAPSEEFSTISDEFRSLSPEWPDDEPSIG